MGGDRLSLVIWARELGGCQLSVHLPERLAVKVWSCGSAFQHFLKGTMIGQGPTDAPGGREQEF